MTGTPCDFTVRLPDLVGNTFELKRAIIDIVLPPVGL